MLLVILLILLLVILLMIRVLFSFLLKLNSCHHYTFYSPLQQSLKQNHRASHNCYSVKYMMKRLAFKWLLNESLFETELQEVMLRFAWIKFIRSVLYQPINRPSKCIISGLLRESNEKIYLLMCFDSSKLHDITKWN